MKHYRTDTGGLRVITGRADGVLVLVWPLVAEQKFGFTQLKWMGDPVTQYGDILVVHSALTALWLKQAHDFVRNRLPGDALFLRKVRADSNVAALLLASDATVTQEQAAPYIDLTRFETYEDYFKLFGKKARKNRRRHRRRMEEEGDIAFEFHKAGKTAGQVARTAIALKRVWLKEKGLVSQAYVSTAMDNFFQAACTDTVRSTEPYITEWKVSGETATIEVAFEHKGHHLAHVGVYHPKYERHSPGTLQMEDTIRSCIDRGLHTYDLMAPADPYKMQWCDAKVPVYDFAMPASAKGQLYVSLYINGLRKAAQNLMHMMPNKARHVIAPLAARLMRRFS